MTVFTVGCYTPREVKVEEGQKTEKSDVALHEVHRFLYF
jgi:hypothetical protein